MESALEYQPLWRKGRKQGGAEGYNAVTRPQPTHPLQLTRPFQAVPD